MPLYSFECSECHKRDAVFRKIASRNEAPLCCDKSMVRVIEAAAIQADLPGYQSPIDGRWIEGKRARMEDMKRNGCRPWEGMESEKKEAQRRAEYADKDYEKGLEAQIMNTYNNMSAEKQRLLAKGD